MKANGVTGRVVYPTLSYISHSCVCNARYRSIISRKSNLFTILTTIFISTWWEDCKNMNWNLTVAFWPTCMIQKPFQLIWQQFLPCLGLSSKSHHGNWISCTFFAVPMSSRHEKCCQTLKQLFVSFHHSRNILWLATILQIILAKFHCL